jgi:aminoglycoside phosphotransferase (APT) family kinase protein
MIPKTGDYIDVLLQQTQRFILPSATMPDAVLAANMLNMALSYIAAEERHGREMSQARMAAARPILSRARQFVADSARVSGETAESAAVIASIDRALEEDASIRSSEQALSETVSYLHAVGTGLAGGEATGLIKDIVSEETAFLVGAVREYDRWHQGAALAEEKIVEQPYLTVDLVNQYISERMKSHLCPRATRVVEIGGGFAKRTYLLDTQGGATDWNSMVVRQDVIGGPTPESVLNEVDVIRCVHAYGIPAPAILHVESDPVPLGAPFIFAARRPGVCSDASWGVRRAGEPSPGEQLARCIAELHQLSPALLGPWAGALDARTVLTGYVQSFEARWNRDRPNDEPLIRAGFDWLLTHVPQEIPRLAIVHADISPRNVLVDEGMLSAVLDWELWHIGDPVYDLAYIRRWLANIMDWERFLAIYRGHGGPDVNLKNCAYWDIFFRFRDAAMLASGVRSFLDGKNRNLKIIAPVMYYYRRCLAEGAQLLHTML